MTVKRGIKKKEHEKLTPANIEKVINLLESKPAITKKTACDILNITYNTTRLNNIIEEYKDEIEQESLRRAANKGKPLTNFERQSIIEWVFDGEGITEISKRLYRSFASVTRAIEEIGIPERSESYVKPALLPEQCVRETFEPGELIWVATRNCIGVILPEDTHSVNSNGENVYGIYEFERIEDDSGTLFANCRAGDYGGRYAYQRASELGSLEHLKQFGVDLSRTYKPHFPRSLKKRLGMEVK